MWCVKPLRVVLWLVGGEKVLVAGHGVQGQDAAVCDLR